MMSSHPIMRSRASLTPVTQMCIRDRRLWSVYDGSDALDKNELQKRMEQAIRLTAPGQPIRTALDMIIAGHLGALICVGDTENVLAAGNDGFPLNISFTSNRLFDLYTYFLTVIIIACCKNIVKYNMNTLD